MSNAFFRKLESKIGRKSNIPIEFSFWTNPISHALLQQNISLRCRRTTLQSYTHTHRSKPIIIYFKMIYE